MAIHFVLSNSPCEEIWNAWKKCQSNFNDEEVEKFIQIRSSSLWVNQWDVRLIYRENKFKYSSRALPGPMPVWESLSLPDWRNIVSVDIHWSMVAFNLKRTVFYSYFSTTLTFVGIDLQANFFLFLFVIDQCQRCFNIQSNSINENGIKTWRMCRCVKEFFFFQIDRGDDIENVCWYFFFSLLEIKYYIWKWKSNSSWFRRNGQTIVTKRSSTVLEK